LRFEVAAVLELLVHLACGAVEGDEMDHENQLASKDPWSRVLEMCLSFSNSGSFDIFLLGVLKVMYAEREVMKSFIMTSTPRTQVSLIR
jgi:hypothetical protein